MPEYPSEPRPSPTRRRRRHSRDREKSDGSALSVSERLIEIVAVLLLGMTTIGTAWCAYEAAQWNGRSGDLARVASEQHIESARLFGRATQRVSYDSQIVAQYAAARSAGNVRLLQFYRRSLIRPDFLPVLDRWEATIGAGKLPTGLTEDPEYRAAQLGDYERAVKAAGELHRGQPAGR